MERRYGRANRTYRLSTEKQKKPTRWLLPVRFRGIMCAVLLAAGVITSFATDKAIHQKTADILYHINTYEDWEATFVPVAKTMKTSAIKVTAKWNRAVAGAFERAGISSSPPQTHAKAKAQKSEKNRKPKKQTDNAVATDQNSEDANESTKSEPQFLPPTDGEISSTFGERLHPINGQNTMHTGIDIATPYGQTVVASCEGTVEQTGCDASNGNYVVVDHSSGVKTVYAHMSKICVEKGESVNHQTKLGEVGSSGLSTGPHLHFEVKVNSQSVNPENYISIVHRAGV